MITDNRLKEILNYINNSPEKEVLHYDANEGHRFYANLHPHIEISDEEFSVLETKGLIEWLGGDLYKVSAEGKRTYYGLS